jgi:hypothetical protein
MLISSKLGSKKSLFISDDSLLSDEGKYTVICFGILDTIEARLGRSNSGNGSDKNDVLFTTSLFM